MAVVLVVVALFIARKGSTCKEIILPNAQKKDFDQTLETPNAYKVNFIFWK